MLLDNPVIEVMSSYPPNSTSGQLIILQDRGLRYYDEGRWKSGHNDFDFAALIQLAGTSFDYQPEHKVTVRSLMMANISGADCEVTVKRNGIFLLYKAFVLADQTVVLDIAVPLSENDHLLFESTGEVACSVIGSDADDYEVIAVGSNVNVVSTYTSVITAMVLCNRGETDTTATVKFCFNGQDSEAAIFLKDLPIAVGESVFGDIKHVLPADGRLIVEGVNVDVLFSGGVYG